MRGLAFDNVTKRFRGLNGQIITAVDAVSLRLVEGESVALVGESGSGKSTVARLATRLERPTGGTVSLDGVTLSAVADLPASVQMIFQDPFSSLNPAHTIGYSIQRPIAVKERISARAARLQACDALQRVGLTPPEPFMEKRVSQLSGGQRQRANIARAIALSPRFMIADEPTSMLDVSVGLGILNLLLDLRAEEMAFLFITHNLAAARYVADRVIVLYRGTIVESGAIDDVIQRPLHPYTKDLVAATPDPALPFAGGRIADPEAVEPGWCPFAPRCAQRHAGCETPIALRIVEGEHAVRCTLYP